MCGNNNKVLFTSWTMKSSLALLKYVIGCWTRLETIYVLHQDFFLRVTMELEGPKRLIFYAYVIHCHDPMGFVVGEAIEVVSLQMFGTVAEICRFNSFNIDFHCFFFLLLPNVFIVTRKVGGEEWEKVKHEVNSENYPFWTYIKKKLACPLLGAWSFLLVHVHFTPSQCAQRIFEMYF